jgi:hypothetical protein
MQVFVLKYFGLVVQNLNRLMKAIIVMGAWRHIIKISRVAPDVKHAALGPLRPRRNT